MKIIDSAMLMLMIQSASANLKNKRKTVDDLNVFPVPDGDTGTNMSLTFSGATSMLSELETNHAGKLFAKLASASLRNARGNSGVILSQIVRGFAKGVENKEYIDVQGLKDALLNSKATAYRAVMKPTEGTILTVLREMSEYAENSYSDDLEIDEYLHNILEAGKESLARTTEMLPALKQAGVVDAGGMGLIVLFEGMVYALENGQAIEPNETDTTKTVVKTSAVSADIKYLYCTEFIINKKADRQATQFRSAISEKGDCMLVIDDDDIVKVHIHTNHPGYVIEQALKLGELTNLKIDNMKYQHDEKNAEPENETETPKASAEPSKKYGFVAVSAGAGLSDLFSSLNVDEIIEGGQTMNPSTQQILDAVNKVPAEIVFVLPNNKNIILAAEQVDSLTEKGVFVVPTTNIPQGISAMMAFDESLSPEDNLSAMMDFANSVSCGQVTFAARDTVLDGVEIKEGDCLGIDGKDIVSVTASPESAATELVSKLVSDDSAVISIYYGEDVSKETADTLLDELSENFPDLDVSLYYGGQPVYCYIISVE